MWLQSSVTPTSGDLMQSFDHMGVPSRDTLTHRDIHINKNKSFSKRMYRKPFHLCMKPRITFLDHVVAWFVAFLDHRETLFLAFLAQRVALSSGDSVYRATALGTSTRKVS